MYIDRPVTFRRLTLVSVFYGLISLLAARILATTDSAKEVE